MCSAVGAAGVSIDEMSSSACQTYRKIFRFIATLLVKDLVVF
jgi:hypothetical protein